MWGAVSPSARFPVTVYEADYLSKVGPILDYSSTSGVGRTYRYGAYSMHYCPPHTTTSCPPSIVTVFNTYHLRHFDSGREEYNSHRQHVLVVAV